jgi:hypothetical protein
MRCSGIFKDFYPKGKDSYHKAIRYLHVIYTIVSVIVIILVVMDVLFSVNSSDHTKVDGEHCNRSANYSWSLINKNEDPNFSLGFAQMEDKMNFPSNLVMSLDSLINFSKETEETISKINLVMIQRHTTNITITKRLNRIKHPSKIGKVGANRKQEGFHCCCHCTPYASDTCMNFNQ